MNHVPLEYLWVRGEEFERREGHVPGDGNDLEDGRVSEEAEVVEYTDIVVLWIQR